MRYNSEQLHKIVQESLATNNIKQAVAACRELNNTFPDAFEGWHISGELHRTLNNPETGLLATDRALALRPNDSSVELQRVEFLHMLGRREEAIKLLIEVSEKNKSFAKEKLNKKETALYLLDKTSI